MDPEQDAIYWEDVEVGSVATTPGRTVTESDIVNFAGLSGDWHVLHTNVEFAKTTPFGQRIAHGVLGLSVATGLVARLSGVEKHRFVAFLGMTWDFRHPVFIGDTIHVVQSVSTKRATSKPGLGVIEFAVEVKNQDGTICQEGVWKTMYMMRNVTQDGT